MKETGMKLQGKVEMKDPHPPVVLIPLRSWHIQKCCQEQLRNTSPDPVPVAGSKPTGRSVLPGQAACAQGLGSQGATGS